AVERLAALGARVEEVQTPALLDELFEQGYRSVQRPEAYTYHSDMGWLTERAELYTPEVRANILLGGDYTAADYIRGQRQRRQFTDEMRALLGEVDALATPTVAIPAATPDEVAARVEVHQWSISGEQLCPRSACRLSR